MPCRSGAAHAGTAWRSGSWWRPCWPRATPPRPPAPSAARITSRVGSAWPVCFADVHVLAVCASTSVSVCCTDHVQCEGFALCMPLLMAGVGLLACDTTSKGRCTPAGAPVGSRARPTAGWHWAPVAQAMCCACCAADTAFTWSASTGGCSHLQTTRGRRRAPSAMRSWRKLRHKKAASA